jgi:hypothetical protein
VVTGPLFSFPTWRRPPAPNYHPHHMHTDGHETQPSAPEPVVVPQPSAPEPVVVPQPTLQQKKDLIVKLQLLLEEFIDLSVQIYNENYDAMQYRGEDLGTSEKRDKVFIKFKKIITDNPFLRTRETWEEIIATQTVGDKAESAVRTLGKMVFGDALQGISEDDHKLLIREKGRFYQQGAKDLAERIKMATTCSNYDFTRKVGSLVKDLNHNRQYWDHDLVNTSASKLVYKFATVVESCWNSEIQVFSKSVDRILQCLWAFHRDCSLIRDNEMYIQSLEREYITTSVEMQILFCLERNLRATDLGNFVPSTKADLSAIMQETDQQRIEQVVREYTELVLRNCDSILTGIPSETTNRLTQMGKNTLKRIKQTIHDVKSLVSTLKREGLPHLTYGSEYEDEKGNKKTREEAEEGKEKPSDELHSASREKLIEDMRTWLKALIDAAIAHKTVSRDAAQTLHSIAREEELVIIIDKNYEKFNELLSKHQELKTLKVLKQIFDGQDKNNISDLAEYVLGHFCFTVFGIDYSELAI